MPTPVVRAAPPAVYASAQLKLSRLLQLIFQAQARELRGRLGRVLDSGEAPTLTHWTETMMRGLQPVYLEVYQAGMVRSAERLAKLAGERPAYSESPPPSVDPLGEGGPVQSAPAAYVPPAHGLRRIVLPSSSVLGSAKSWGAYVRRGWWSRGGREWRKANRPAAPRFASYVPPGYYGPSAAGQQPSPNVPPLPTAPTFPQGRGFGMDFDLFNPRVLDAVQSAVFAFCRSTMETATGDLQTSLDLLRSKLARGLERGEALALLSQRVQTIFADPVRAFRIAATETSRAMHGGALLAAKQSGLVVKKRWLASTDACDECLELDGREVGLDEPFYVDPRGGPYAVVLYPPLHPHCFCDFTEVI